jgi:hypothetical protein
MHGRLLRGDLASVGVALLDIRESLATVAVAIRYTGPLGATPTLVQHSCLTAPLGALPRPNLSGRIDESSTRFRRRCATGDRASLRWAPRTTTGEAVVAWEPDPHHGAGTLACAVVVQQRPCGLPARAARFTARRVWRYWFSTRWPPSGRAANPGVSRRHARLPPSGRYVRSAPICPVGPV